jgi:hypothetical protein
MVCISRAILSPFSDFVDKFNSAILRTVPGQSPTYISSDSIEGDTDGSDNSILDDPEFLNSLNEPGIPPHELILKVGTICRLTRNLNAARGLTKNTPTLKWAWSQNYLCLGFRVSLCPRTFSAT